MLEETKITEIMDASPGLSRDMAERIYTSHLIGANPDWVLHGGGNTSVKQVISDLFGEDQTVLYIKGSGVDMADIKAEDFTALKLTSLQRLRQLTQLSDEEMDNQLKINKLQAGSPDPSVEALLHAFLPHKFIDHTHADSILALTNRINADILIQQVLGPAVRVIPYEKSGLDLALKAYAAWESNPEAEAIVILHHGIFTFGEDAETAFNRMAGFITRAEAWLKDQPQADLKWSAVARDDGTTIRIAQIIRGACAVSDNTNGFKTPLVDIRDQNDIIEASVSENAQNICDSGG